MSRACWTTLAGIKCLHLTFCLFNVRLFFFFFSWWFQESRYVSQWVTPPARVKSRKTWQVWVLFFLFFLTLLYVYQTHIVLRLMNAGCLRSMQRFRRTRQMSPKAWQKLGLTTLQRYLPWASSLYFIFFDQQSIPPHQHRHFESSSKVRNNNRGGCPIIVNANKTAWPVRMWNAGRGLKKNVNMADAKHRKRAPVKHDARTQKVEIKAEGGKQWESMEKERGHNGNNRLKIKYKS